MSELQRILNGDQQTKIRIFEVAAKLFAEKGYNGVSMREISEMSKVSKPTIYYYFGNKEGIFKELIEVGMKYGSEKTEEIIASDMPIKQKLIKLVQNRFQASYKHPELAKFYLSVFVTSENIPFIDDYQTFVKKHRKMLIDIIRQGVVSGEFGPRTNPELAVEIIGAVLGHFIRLQFKSKKRILTDEFAEEIVELLFRGLNE